MDSPVKTPESRARVSPRLLPAAATVTWMNRRRRSPAAAWLDVRSSVAVGMNCGLEEDPLAACEAVVSVHACGRERHARRAGGKQELQNFMGSSLRIMFPGDSVVASAPENARRGDGKVRSTGRLEH